MAGLVGEHAVAGAERIDQRGLPCAGAGARKNQHVPLRLKDRAQAVDAGEREIGRVAAAMIDRRLIDGAQDAVRNIRRAGNLEKVSAGSICHRSSQEKIAYENRGMQRRRPAEVGHLVAARSAGRDQDVARRHRLRPPEGGVGRRWPSTPRSVPA